MEHSKGSKKFIYADNAATTGMHPEVMAAMMPYFCECYGNPSSLYSFGQEAKNALDNSREIIAKSLNCNFDEVFFTSGGSEADNWAIKSMAEITAKKGKNHIISTQFEHHAVIHTLEYLEKKGFEITLLPVYENGIVKAEDLIAAIRPDTGFVSIMLANNEIGTIQPIKELAAICNEQDIVFHTDAVQAVGHIPVDFADLGVSLLSLSGHKFHGPKGVGALIIKKRLRFPNLIHGGAQEKNRRAGTENVAGIVGMAMALAIATDKLEQSMAVNIKHRDRLISGLLDKVDKARLNGDAVNRLPGNVNISFEGVEGESLLLMLDFEGICASSGSACTSGSLDPSHVLLSIGLTHGVAHGSLRLTIDDDLTHEDIDYIIEKVPPVVQKLREWSPIWEKILKGERYE